MRERPIIFSGPMVRAILEGRKTQTRRIVTWMPPGRYPEPLPPNAELEWAAADGYTARFNVDGTSVGVTSRYGIPGQDTLWVRETWGRIVNAGHRYVYRADGDPRDRFSGEVIAGMKWSPSIHMPRGVSRITLRVTSVRVERLQEIAEEDARAEGVAPTRGLNFTARHEFAELWDEINGKRAPWASNPFVWVIGFKREVQP